MFNQEITDSLKQELEKANSILILLPPEPDELLISSSLSLFLSLKNLEKKVQIGCSNLNKDNISKLNGLDNIKQSIGSHNLIINFQFKEKDLDKVDYDVDSQGNFQLMVKPKSGSLPPDTKDINYTYSGANADLVIVLGINSKEELGKLYSDEKKFLDDATIISLNKDSRPADFATLSLHTNSATSIAEIVSFLLLKTKIEPTAEAANLLLKEIYSTTNNLSTPRVTADTFETIAFLIRKGARPPVTSTFTPTPDRLSPPPVFDQPSSLKQIPPAQVPSDWKKPKIFRSSPGNQ
jgi:nanoRNase/pAp phosphatase (c-di-AMP/oligoRNAs hydrolase)